MSSLPIAYRPAQESDVPLILKSWLRSYADSDFARHIGRDVYFPRHREVIARLLGAAYIRGPHCLVAYDESAPEAEPRELGWACAHGPLVHWCYVKETYRRLGIARELLARLVPDGRPLTVTHLPREREADGSLTTGAHLLASWRRRGRTVVYDPYAALEGT